MDDCCAPQWADFTASPRLPSDSYFEVEHEVHQSRNRAASEKFEDSLQNKHEDVMLDFGTETNVEDDLSTVRSSQVNISFFVPLENQKGNKKMGKFPGFPYKAVQNVCIANASQTRKNRLSDQAAPVRRRTNTLGRRRASHGKTQAKVLTCQYVRRSLTKNRRRSNQYVTFAEAVSKFQSETPQRFRTISNKNLKPMPPVKTKQKLTYPVSPALRCRYRTRISTNPAGTSVTTESVVAPKSFFKKLPTTAEEPCLNRSEKPIPVNNKSLDVKPALQPKEEQYKRKIFSASVNNIPEKKEEISEKKDHSTMVNNCKTIPRLPAAFAARNREFQLKREQKLKALQEMATMKPEFHAKPVPKFVKKSVTPAQEHTPAKKSVVPCPFSFDQRDKCLAKQKVERLKQLQQQDKKAHVFHANPAPSFKLAPIRSTSRENLRNKDQEKYVARQTRSCIGQENRVPNIINLAIPACAKKNEVKSGSRKVAQENQVEAVHKKPVDKPEVPPLLLNTDKRAKERCEFDEKIRKKKAQEESERQEREKNKLSREKQEQTELRKLAETRARPMPIFKPPIILKSSKPLTSPKSPAWANKTKSMKHAS